MSVENLLPRVSDGPIEQYVPFVILGRGTMLPQYQAKVIAWKIGCPTRRPRLPHVPSVTGYLPVFLILPRGG
jgi:hypothetical protein